MNVRQKKCVGFSPLGCTAASLIFLLLAGCSSGASAQPQASRYPAARSSRTAGATETSMPTATPLSPTSTSIVTPAYGGTATMQYGQTVTQDFKTGEVDSMLEGVSETLGNGRIEYFQSESQTIQVKGFNQKHIVPLPIIDSVGDFAFHSKITWSSDLGSAGCGLLYREENGDPGKGKYYEFLINRFSGLPNYSIDLNDTYLFSKQVGFGYTGYLNDLPGSENNILLVVKGTEFRIYINGQRSNAVYDATVPAGQLSLVASTVSGNATCQFADTWIWSWGKH